MQKGGKQLLLVRCKRAAFSKSSLIEKYRSIPIGRILHLDWRGYRFESCLLYMVCSSNGSGYRAFYLVIPVRIRYRLQTRENLFAIAASITVRWCNG